MPLVTTLVDDKSPLISYDSTWIPGTSVDQYADQYYLGTFTINDVPNGTAWFSFNGTGVWVYGAKRGNHYTYDVQLDGNTYGPYDGYYPTQEFLQVLFNTTGLTQGMHNLTLTNTATNSSYVDIDLVVWQSEVGSGDQQLITETVQDTDSRFQYQMTERGNIRKPTRRVRRSLLRYVVPLPPPGHETIDLFQGEMVTLFGATSTSTGLYTVQLDGGNVSKYNATAFLPFYGVTLFHADNLGPGQHSLTIANVPATPGQQLCIDYALVYSLANGTSTTGLSGTGGSTGGNTSSQRLSSGGIAGIAVAAAAAVLGFLLAFFFYRKMKSAEATYNHLCSVHTAQRQPEIPIGISTSMEARGPPSLVRQGSGYLPSSGPTQLGDESRSQLLGRSIPATPSEGGWQSPQPFQDGRTPTIQNAEIEARSPSPTATELPPAYAHAMRTGGA
ncbi:hypothetical protein PISMIDRAFT_12265 [Pisolithus microcarpus 441]|uniref:Unplaced genomic scaffold scaffold_67, whole genome shotgun sequence n=1 Tax=Pisolithus microcarpus 441 TaxID=765257 RepID=A0A0C9ZGB9_9AGAM|nr:hypothetical protein PISMIDRAFT_12265 [Pisolithus microcarpus 441]